jgi:hypothetical protein
MAIAAGPFPLPSPPWQEAQYFTNVCLPDPALVCFTAGSYSFFPSARTMPRATASTAPERITLNVDIGSFSRFAGWTRGVTAREQSSRLNISRSKSPTPCPSLVSFKTLSSQSVYLTTDIHSVA